MPMCFKCHEAIDAFDYPGHVTFCQGILSKIFRESEMAVEIDESTAKMHAKSVRSNARLFCEAVQAARNAGLHVEIEIEDSGDAPVIVIDVWQPR